MKDNHIQNHGWKNGNFDVSRFCYRCGMLHINITFEKSIFKENETSEEKGASCPVVLYPNTILY